jgi:hypothetical protein
MDLIKKALCKDSPDYESLVANLQIVTNTIDCDDQGKVVLTQPGFIILHNLFNKCDGHWSGCFDDRILYYYDKDCKCLGEPYEPGIESDPCILDAIIIASTDCMPHDATYHPISEQNIMVRVTTQGNIYVSEVTEISINNNPTSGDRIVLHTQCGNKKYVFYFGADCPCDIHDATIYLVPLGNDREETATNLNQCIRDATLEDDETLVWDTELCLPVSETDPNPLIIVGSIIRAPVIRTFRQITELLSYYLGELNGWKLFDDVTSVIHALCAVLRGRIYLDRILVKKMLTIDKCD